jgi:hypothetical protein
MLPRLATRLSEWIQCLPETLRGRGGTFGAVLEARLSAGDSLQQALEEALPRLGAASVVQALKAEDGPVALVCVDLLSSLNDQLHLASAQLSWVEQPWAQWTSARLQDFAAALESDVVHTHLVNAVLAEAAVTSELIPIEVRAIERRALQKRVVQVLLSMRSTVFTRADLVQTASTLGHAQPSGDRLADA